MARVRVAAAPPAAPAADAGTGTPEAAEVDRVLVTDHTWVRRRTGWTFWVPALACVLGLTALAATRSQPHVESALTGQVRAALHRAHLDQVRAQVDGRAVTLDVPTGASSDRAVKVVDGVAGVASVDTVAVFASRREARACAALADDLERVTRHQRIPFVGESTRLAPSGVAMVEAAARLLRACRPAAVVVGGHTDGATVGGSTLSLRRAEVMVRLLVAAGVDKDRLTPRGYGDQFPVSDADGASARAANQRGSIEVVS